jgi:anthranilate/para-aminobenzoate synthase component I
MNPRLQTRLTPLACARALTGAGGLSFLDSSLPGPGTISLVAAQPDLVLAGNDWNQLENELARRRRPGPDLGYPDGAAIGWIGFDGTFRFAFHEKVHIFLHETDCWIVEPDVTEMVPARLPTAIDFSPRIGRDEFVSMVARAREFIAAGDIYQVCLAHPFLAETEADPWTYYEQLRHYSPAPYSAYLDSGDLRIASASPECFLRMSGRTISTSPIKGTRPRRADPHSDRRSAYDLITSPKEIAELVMITDLERNDLGKVCEYGSVTVTELLRLEQFEQVFHLVSKVTGQLRPEVSHPAALRACFPGGSISGAPKKRAIEIIRALEPFDRGLYTGAIGYFGFNGESQFSIAIRTAVFEKCQASFHVGAGIVADSDPGMEWQETLDKARGLLLAAGQSGE